mmetsp:Transcript_6909/g.10080  ORF Transcript_6909/g.10080 Transcript_6909/m.10080 type:complete len:287 (-) Transcript_6909:70-930(-)
MMINKFFFALSVVSLTALLNNGAVVAFTPSGGVNTRVSLSTTSSSKIAPPSLLLTPDQERSLIMAPLSMSTKQEDDDDARWEDVSKKLELIGLGVWLLGISGFILVNNFVGPWPAVMKEIPERTFFLNHMVGGMLFGGGIILTTCIEWLVAKNKEVSVLQFWFNKVPILDTLIVVPALTVSMISGTGLTIRRYGGLGTAPPHVDAIFWTLILFLSWWAATDLTTQGTALKAVNDMPLVLKKGEEVEVPQVVLNRHFSNVISCFFILMLYSVMVLKPGTLIPFPWDS